MQKMLTFSSSDWILLKNFILHNALFQYCFLLKYVEICADIYLIYANAFNIIWEKTKFWTFYSIFIGRSKISAKKAWYIYYGNGIRISFYIKLFEKIRMDIPIFLWKF